MSKKGNTGYGMASYQAIYEKIRDIIVILDKNLLVSFINKAAIDYFKISAHEMVGKSVFEIFALAGCKSPIQSNYFEFRKPLNVEINNIAWDVSIVSDKNNEEAVLLVASEVQNEHHKTTAKNLSQIIDCAPGSLYWKDKEGRYLGCNMFMVKTAGLQSPLDIIGKTDFDLWPKNAKRIRKNDEQVMKSGQTVYLEEKVKVQAGHVMYFASSKAPLKDENGNVVGIVCTSLGITKLKKTEHKLKLATEKAED